MFFFDKKEYKPPQSVLLSGENPFEQYEYKKNNYLKKEEDKIAEFEKKYNPYEILNVSQYCTKAELKKAYKKLALYHHPDKGGKEELFDIVNQAYNIVERRLNQVVPKEKIEHNELKKSFKKPVYKPMKKKDFNLNKFNKVFENNKVSSVNDKGYGDWNEEIKDENIKGNITKNNFNEMFQKSRNTNNYSKQIITYDEPTALASGDLSFSELGQDTIDNFSKGESEGNSIDFTDYKSAYTNDSKLINPNDFNIDRPQTLNKYTAERENISYNMSDSMKRQLEQKEFENNRVEQDRLQRVQMFDEEAAENYNRMKKLMLKN